ncbi:MAG TPA: glycosyltransferase family 4 protein [Gammaproteobacteria bacterium]|nr:glycosyltransferase family 4 protein [Gammaproteobacteria bacterium]
MDDKKILMVLIEPTPYILDLLAVLITTWRGKIDIIFLADTFSQDWKLSLEKNYIILSKNPIIIIQKIYRYIVNGNYKVIFLAGWIHPVCWSLLVLAKIFRIPVVVDSDTPLFPFIPLWKRMIKRVVYPYLFKLPRMFLPGGTRQAKYLKHYNVPSKKIMLEKMTVDVTGIQRYIRQLPADSYINLRKRFCFTPNDFIFLFIGRLIERKGIKELLKAFSKIKNNQIKLVIVGDGPLKPYLENVLQSTNNIYYAGRLEKEEIIEMYFISNVFVLPAHWEPWGLVINEAMAAGNPVIVSDQVGCADDLIIPGKTGLIIKNQSVDDLLKAMIYFLENAETYAIMSKNTLDHIANWTLENEAKNICTAWKYVLSAQS